MRTVNRSTLAATLSLSAVVASIFAFGPAAYAQVPAVSQDPTIVGTPAVAAGNAAAVGTFATSASGSNPAATQYFAGGATFPSIILRNLLDFYGIAVPNTVPNIGAPGSTGFQPFNSPRSNFLQYNYCATGSGNGRGIFLGSAVISASCSYVSSTSGAAALINPKAPTALTNPPSDPSYAFTPVPNFPTGVQATITTAPLFSFSDQVAGVSGLTATEITTYTTNKFATRGNPIQVPVLFGAVVPAFNAAINGGISPNLTVVDLCKIFDGTITDYSQLVAPSTVGLSGPIDVTIRSDSSGTTLGFTGFLAAACANAGVVTPGFAGYYITAGLNVFPTTAGFPSATFQRRPGNDGVADRVATTTGGFGYVEASFAQPLATNAPITLNTPAPIQAALQNTVSGNFLTATTNAVRNALANVALSANATYPCVLTSTGVPVVPTVGNAYPIVTQTYSFTYTVYSTQAEVNAVRNLFSFILGNRTTPIQANDQIAGAAGAVILGRGTTAATINPLRQQARACINSARI
jgi:ABC-type phosphate transport system substrate-binding protein